MGSTVRIIKTTEPRPTDILGQLALYNGFDCLSLPEIMPQLLSEMEPCQRAIYDFEMEMQAPLLEMEFNGSLVDIPKRQELTFIYRRKQLEIEKTLHTFCKAIGYYDYYKELAVKQYSDATNIDRASLPRTWAEWLALPIWLRKEWKKISEQALEVYQKQLKETDKPFNANSVKQKLQLFYHFFGSPNNSANFAPETNIGKLFEVVEPPWQKTRGINVYKSRGQNGEYSPSTDRGCLEKIQKRADASDNRDASYWAQPFISCCLAIADYTKTLGFLKCKLEDGIFRSTFSISTKTGRMASRSNSQGYGWNAQNISPPLRVILIAPEGYKVGACDYEQIESRNVGAICYTLFGAVAYLNAGESGDLHSLACSMVWDNLPWPSDFTLSWLEKHGPFPPDMIRAAKKIAGQEFYRGKSRRDVSKTLGHGSNYLGQPFQMAKHSHIDIKLVEHYQQVYFEAFPEIQQWHNHTIEQVQVYQEITTIPPFNRKRQCFGRPSDDSVIREMVAYAPQSMAADYTNRALLNIHKEVLTGKLPLKLFLQKHDEIGFHYQPEDEQLVLARVCDIMEQPYTLTDPSGNTREWKIPVEAQVGWSLGHKGRDGSNPDGLIVYQGTDERTRVKNPFNLLELIL